MTTGTFTVTFDSITTAFTTTIPTGNSLGFAQVATTYVTGRTGDIFIESVQVSGTTLIVNIWQATQGILQPVDNTLVASLDINYLVA